MQIYIFYRLTLLLSLTTKDNHNKHIKKMYRIYYEDYTKEISDGDPQKRLAYRCTTVDFISNMVKLTGDLNTLEEDVAINATDSVGNILSTTYEDVLTPVENASEIYLAQDKVKIIKE